MFSKSLSPFEELKTNKSVFKSDPEILSCFELNYKFLERYKKPLLLATMRKQENPVNTVQKITSQIQTNKTEKRQWRKCQGQLSHIQKKKINTFKDHIVPENTKKSTPLAFILSRGT